MKNIFENSNTNKRYYTLDYYYKKKYNNKVAKLSLNGNFSCPNLDGTKGFGGCIYCSKSGSGEYGGSLEKSIKDQIKEQKEMIKRKWPNAKYISYFQARTNTYASIDKLKKLYEEALDDKNVVGLSIATRADSIEDDCLEYLKELNMRTELIVELGLQTINEKTSKLINRCSTIQEFEDTLQKLRKNNINTVVHIINGLPHETEQDMLNTVKYLNKKDIQGIKIHMLSIVKDTPLEKYYKKTKFKILTQKEYIDITIKQLELLNKDIVIHRITGDPKKEDLIEPKWITNKRQIINDIDKEMVKRNTYQGKKCSN